MSDFKVIETQEQLDAVIGERIARAEQKAAEKYADYEDIKSSMADKDKQIAELSAQLKENGEKQGAHEEQIKELKSKVHEYEQASVKTRIAHEEGLPYELAARLTGEDEDAIRDDAKAMAKFISKPVAPLGSNEPAQDSNSDPVEVAFQNMVRDIRKGE